MKKKARRFLSVLLALAMLFSHVDLSFAKELGKSSTAASGSQSDGTVELEMEDMDPAKLNVKKLGEVTEDEDGDDGDVNLTPDTSLEQTVRVSIFLSEKSTIEAGYSTMGIASNRSAAAYRDTLKAKQAELTSRIEAALGHKLDVKWNLTLLANAISANIKVKEIPLIERLNGVYKVERERRYEAPVTDGEAAEPNTANTSANMVGAQNAWYQLRYTGAGTKIAIIDTGLDTDHQSVNNDAFLKAINEVRASGKTVELMTSIPTTGLNAANPKRISDKIPYAYNYIDNNNTNVAHKDSAGNHGSHVAGIAAANRYIKQGSTYVDAAETVNAVGMAPDAQILVMKVFGSGGGAYDSDYFAALEDAVVLGADAANLSLGSAAPGWTYDTEYQAKLNAFVNNENNHMVVSISAGNSDAFDDHTSHKLYAEDAFFHTGGSPGSFINSLGVAAAQNTLTEGKPLIFNGSQQVFYTEDTENNDGEAYTKPLMATVAGGWEFVYIDALGTVEDYAAVDRAANGLAGKIVIINRGEISFVEKGNNAISYNPKALIVANNDSGAIHMDLTEFTGTFPYVSMALRDAETLKASSTAHTAGSITYYTGRVEVKTTDVSTFLSRDEAEISSFSSWGGIGSLLMKPEIVAPGGDINSIFGTSNADSGSSTTTYAVFSGTSMAAPHIAGLSAVLMQYLKEFPEAPNEALFKGYTLRAIAQSLLMSTATPMINSNAYLSILQQGAGLVEISKAIEAKSVIMMDEAYLTSDTGAAADGKVKVELGDDPARKGEYEYKFTIYNISDETLEFELDTDLFTQAISGDTLSHKTVLLPYGGVTYTWNGQAPAESHDVDKDGDTDNDDAQAILDYLSGVKEEADVNLDVADMDGDDYISSRDAYLLIDWAAEAQDGYFVGPHDKAQVTVRISLTDEQKAVFEERECGGYIEGYTYVSCVTTTKEGEKLDHEHTIPILGYYGSWTDPSMFDTNSYTENLYGNEQENYSGSTAAGTNYMRVTTNGVLQKFSGNPYTVEEAFPAERLAIRSDATINNFAYNMIRSAAGTGFAVSKLDADGNVSNILYLLKDGDEVYGCWFHVNNQTWQNTTTKQYNVGRSLSEFGTLAEGDRVRVGFYAIPELNTMKHSSDLTDPEAGFMDNSMFRDILMSGELGKGAFMGFDLAIDDTAPVIASAALSGNTLSIEAGDNENLAYIAVMSLDGSVVYAEAVPGTDSYTVSFDASEAIANALGYVAAFVGDYAGNEAAYAIKVNDNTHVEKTVFVQTDTVTAGEEYLIMNTASAGTGYGLYYTLNTAGTIAVNRVFSAPIKPGTAETNGRTFVETADAVETGIWTAGTGSFGTTKTFTNNGWDLCVASGNYLSITKNNSRKTWIWDGSNNRLGFRTNYSTNTYYLRYYNNAFSVSETANSVYMFVKTTISYEVDPYSVSEISVIPTTLYLYKGNTEALTAKVSPLTATDRSVTWSSNDTSIAEVDEFGIVTAKAKGTANIRATSNADPTKFCECTVNVEALSKELSTAIWDERGEVYFSYFSADNLPTWTKRHSTGTGIYVTSALMESENSGTSWNPTYTYSLFAQTNDLKTSNIYTVDRSSYAMTEVGESYLLPFGMAPAGSSFGIDYYVFAFANYIVFGNLTEETDEQLGTFCGFPYGLLDLSETSVGSAYAVAVCVKLRKTTEADYFFLDETGKIWETKQTYSSSDGITFSVPTLVYDTGINAGLMYNSIYFDNTNLYWTRQEGEIAELIILTNVADATVRKLYRAGNFGNGVWPAAGLYRDGAMAPSSVGGGSEIMEAGDEVLDLSGLRIQATRDELLTEDILARFAAAAEEAANSKIKAAQAEEPAEPETTEAAEPETVETPAEPETTEAPAEVTEVQEETTEAEPEAPEAPETTETEPASAEEPAEPETAETPTEPEATEAPAEVTEAPEEETPEAELEAPEAPEVPETTEAEPAPAEEPAEPEATEAPAEEPAEPEITEAPAEGSDEEAYVDPAYTGSLNLVRVVRRTAQQVSDVPEVKAAAVDQGTEPDEVVVTITEEDTAANNGFYSVIYNPDYMTVKTMVSPAAYKSFFDDTDKGIVSFAFADKTAIEAGTAIATVTFTVTNCDTLVGEDLEGLEVLKLELNEDLEEGDSELIDVPGIGHDWGEPTWSWTGTDPNYTAATATFVCEHDSSHTLQLTDTELDYAVTLEPTTEHTGTGVYTATVVLDTVEYTGTKEVTLPKLEAQGYHINVTDYTKGAATTTVDANALYSGANSFTASCAYDFDGELIDAGCTIAVENGDGTYTKLAVTTVDGVHSFTVNVTDADVSLVIVLKGDANLNGVVDTRDMTRIQNAYLEVPGKELTALQALAADANGDGTADGKDMTRIQKAYLGMTVMPW